MYIITSFRYKLWIIGHQINLAKLCNGFADVEVTPSGSSGVLAANSEPDHDASERS